MEIAELALNIPAYEQEDQPQQRDHRLRRGSTPTNDARWLHRPRRLTGDDTEQLPTTTTSHHETVTIQD